MSSLENKYAVIIGGGSGIGQAIAVALARAGCHCVIAGRTVEKLEETIHLAERANIEFHPVDVADRTSVQQLFATIRERTGAVDILVNAAGINIAKRSMAEMSAEEWDRVIQVNATGAYNCLAATLPMMRERKDGLIIQISSIAGKRATPLAGVAYNASKFAMTALGTSVSNEDARHGIRVTNVYPGEVSTPILDQRATPPTTEQRAVMLQPQDIADLVLMICKLPPRAHIPEVVIKPLVQSWV